MKKTALIIMATLSLALASCGTVIEKGAVVAERVGDFQCSTPLSIRETERIVYHEANGQKRLLVGFCPGDKDYAEAVQRWYTDVKAKNTAYKAALSGDFKTIAAEAVRQSVLSGNLKTDADGCFLLDGVGRFCPLEATVE